MSPFTPAQDLVEYLYAEYAKQAAPRDPAAAAAEAAFVAFARGRLAANPPQAVSYTEAGLAVRLQDGLTAVLLAPAPAPAAPSPTGVAQITGGLRGFAPTGPVDAGAVQIAHNPPRPK